MQRTIALFAFVATTLVTSSAFAFCGFFVGSTEGLYNDATQVVLMRKDTHTVLSMRPDYQGPVEDFAMVVPVPQVLDKEDVRTLTDTPFDTIDRLSAPRLVEYHEMDPCMHRRPRSRRPVKSTMAPRAMKGAAMADAAKPKVRVKARFNRDEYQIVILDADESAALEDWLNEHGYKQPKGASKYLAPYIQQGMYFFAAKVDVEKVKFRAGGKAVLSPLQFRYTSKDFQLPIRLGLLNARGDQDLMIFILAEDRYEAANRPNIFIPTNLNVAAKRKDDFAEWYDGVFSRHTDTRKGTVATEYVWPTSIKCDPCPPGTSMLGAQNMMALGGELLQGKVNTRNLVLTRLHTRYNKKHGTSDLVFKKAEPVVGGREIRTDGKLEHGAKKAQRNAFQARYAIRFKWKGPITCENPIRGRWSHSVSAVGLGMPAPPISRPRPPRKRPRPQRKQPR